MEKSGHNSIARNFDIMVRILLKDKYSRTPYAAYPDRLGPSGKFMENPTELVGWVAQAV